MAESCQPGNGAVDPDETVTVSFPLQNIGTAPTANVVATLLPGGGVNAPSGPQSYGALGPVDPPVARSFTFIPGGACGGAVTATLAPAWASASAIARPMPRPPPVTSATR